jgi:FkbM family methyltransferase
LLSRWVGPHGSVLSYESVPYTYSFLRQNVERNGASNVRPEQAAVGNREGVVRTYALTGERLGWSAVCDSGNLDVRCTTIDAEVERLALKHVDFVKLDIEGYELQALAGANETFGRCAQGLCLRSIVEPLERYNTSPVMLLTTHPAMTWFKARMAPHAYKRRLTISNLS